MGVARKLIDLFRRGPQMDYSYYKSLRLDQYPDALKAWYKRKTGKSLNLENPHTFNEKIQWIKLYDSTPIKTRLTDKYLVREWVAKKIGEKYVIPLLGVWDRFDAIDFESLPKTYALKANHGCGWNFLVGANTVPDYSKMRNAFATWLQTNYAFVDGLELQYKDIVPLIIAEEHIDNEETGLNDYKVWCYHGSPLYIQYLANRKTRLQMRFYDTDWHPLPFCNTSTKSSELRYAQPIAKPSNLEELLSLSAELSKDFCYVRVDFYRLDDGSIKFGEMTFTPFSGACYWHPEEYDQKLGSMLRLGHAAQTTDGRMASHHGLVKP